MIRGISTFSVYNCNTEYAVNVVVAIYGVSLSLSPIKQTMNDIILNYSVDHELDRVRPTTTGPIGHLVFISKILIWYWLVFCWV